MPGTVTVYIPYQIVTRWRPTTIEYWSSIQFLSLIPIVLGMVILFHCIWSFAVIGRGTLSPVDTPKQLVVQGLYRYVRNPMYVGVLLILLGEALLFESVMMLKYTVGWFVVINIMVILYEEPTLQYRFGESYKRYRRSVGRWLPGRRFNGFD